VTRCSLIVAVTVLAHAQSPQVKRGAEIFRTTCAVAYCHGPEGTAGRAPKLAGRAFHAEDVFNMVLGGKAGTSMPAFGQQLKSEEIEAVTQYVLSLSDPAGMGSRSARSTVEEMAPTIRMGRALFFDAVRMGGCGRCHELEDRGSPVGPNLKELDAAKVPNPRAVTAAHVVTAKPVDEDAFPAILKEQTEERIRVYDLSSPLPVLRTFRPAEVHLETGGTWSHAAAVMSYSDSDCEAISAYLTAILTPPVK
jgi:mono/diheme cytochrome c family protein